MVCRDNQIRSPEQGPARRRRRRPALPSARIDQLVGPQGVANLLVGPQGIANLLTAKNRRNPAVVPQTSDTGPQGLAAGLAHAKGDAGSPMPSLDARAAAAAMTAANMISPGATDPPPTVQNRLGVLTRHKTSPPPSMVVVAVAVIAAVVAVVARERSHCQMTAGEGEPELPWPAEPGHPHPQSLVGKGVGK